MAWAARIKGSQRSAQTALQHYLAEVAPFGGGAIRGDFVTVFDRPAQRFEPGQRGGFDIGFGEEGHKNLIKKISLKMAAKGKLSTNITTNARMHE
jgi:hypothetical protein